MTARQLPARLTALFDRNGLLAMASGAMIALAFPNSGLSFLAWIGLIPLLIALEGSSPRTAFRLGFTCGLCAYAGILYWINILITVYGHLPWAVSLVLYLILVAWLALFYGLTTLLARAGERVGIKSAFSLPVIWVAADLLRSFLMTGSPWAMLGHSQYRTLPLIQIADICGVFGITLLIVLANVVLYRALRAVSGAGVPYPVKSALLLLVLFIAALGEGLGNSNRQYISNLKADLLVYSDKADFVIPSSRVDRTLSRTLRRVDGVADAGIVAASNTAILLPNN